MGFYRSDLIPINIRLAAAKQGSIYVAAIYYHLAAIGRKASLDELSGCREPG